MQPFPDTLEAFETMFPDDAACIAWLREARWPGGFRCPRCGGGDGRPVARRPAVTRCAACQCDVSATAGTLLHKSQVPPKTWFRAAWLVATHKNGVSGRQLQAQLGLGSDKTAWLLLHKLRRAMVDPNREPLAGLIEIDEASMPYRRADNPVGGGQGRSGAGKMKIIGAVERHEKGPGRLRLAVIDDYSSASIAAFAKLAIAPGAAVLSDAWPAYNGLAVAIGAVRHDMKKIGPMAAHVVLPWIHRLFSNLKRWALGVYHGLRPKHLQA